MLTPRANRARRIPLVTSLALTLLCAGPGTFAAQAHEAVSEAKVSVTPVADNPKVLNLEFESPLLGRRVMNTVYLPTSYRRGGPAMPVMYALHGTVTAQTDNCAIDAVTGTEAFLDMVSCGGGYVQTQLYDIDAQLDRMKFLVVAPDTDPKGSVCHTCMWIDGRADLLPNQRPLTAKAIPADSYLHQELMPLVESMFRTRTDRGGRGVMGFSMGGWAAFLQTFMHPDKYGYLGSVSGAYAIQEPELRGALQTLGYLRDQGYGEPQLNDIWWRQFSPDGIATNMSGVDTEIFLSSGTACLQPSDLTAKDCQGKWAPAVAPGATWAENVLHKQWNIAVRDLAEKSITASSVLLPGTHGSNNHRIFGDFIVPAANQRFAERIRQIPTTFSYRSALPQFSVWGYEVNVKRDNDEFLALTGAGTNGRRFDLRGTGIVEVVTPAKFVPGKRYAVSTVMDSRIITSQTVKADRTGRLHIALDLGPSPRLDENVFINGTGLYAPNTMSVRVRG